MMVTVVGLGGNALSRRGESSSVDLLRARLDVAAAAITSVRARAGATVVTHGNGPQVGKLAVNRPADGLDVLDASTEGELGYLVERALCSYAPGVQTAVLLTQVVVDAHDPAFVIPTKPIGALYDESSAHHVATTKGWVVAPDTGGWRRVVASPQPQRIVELFAIRLLVDGGVTVICAGGGGIPVADEGGGRLRGVDAVIDKDLTSALLAINLDADALLLLTDVDAVTTDFGTARARRIRLASCDYLRSLQLPAGSMGTKVEAACRFVERTGRGAGIGRMEDAASILDKRAGTFVVPQPIAPCWWDDAALGAAPGRRE